MRWVTDFRKREFCLEKALEDIALIYLAWRPACKCPITLYNTTECFFYQVVRVGSKKTAFANFSEIAKMLHRQPKVFFTHLCKCELVLVCKNMYYPAFKLKHSPISAFARVPLCGAWHKRRHWRQQPTHHERWICNLPPMWAMSLNLVFREISAEAHRKRVEAVHQGVCHLPYMQVHNHHVFNKNWKTK